MPMIVYDKSSQFTVAAEFYVSNRDLSQSSYINISVIAARDQDSITKDEQNRQETASFSP